MLSHKLIKPKLTRLLSHTVPAFIPKLGFIFYVNGHSNITIRSVNIQLKSGQLETFFDKSYMMFLKSFGETTISSEEFNDVINIYIVEYLNSVSDPNYSSLYEFLSSKFKPDTLICKEQMNENCKRMNSLLRYLPIYTSNLLSTRRNYIFIPKHETVSNEQMFGFTRHFEFNSDVNSFLFYFSKEQIKHKYIPSELIDVIYEISGSDLCDVDNNYYALKYFSIYFILIYQNILDLPIKHTYLQLDAEIIIDESNPHTFFWKDMDKFIHQYLSIVEIPRSDKFDDKYTTCLQVFSKLFKLQYVIDPPFRKKQTPPSKITTDDIINLNMIFQQVNPENMGNPIIISKSCNVNNPEYPVATLNTLRDYFDEVELHTGKIRARRGSRRKTKSLNNKPSTKKSTTRRVKKYFTA